MCNILRKPLSKLGTGFEYLTRNKPNTRRAYVVHFSKMILIISLQNLCKTTSWVKKNWFNNQPRKKSRHRKAKALGKQRCAINKIIIKNNNSVFWRPRKKAVPPLPTAILNKALINTCRFQPLVNKTINVNFASSLLWKLKHLEVICPRSTQGRVRTTTRSKPFAPVEFSNAAYLLMPRLFIVRTHICT